MSKMAYYGKCTRILMSKHALFNPNRDSKLVIDDGYNKTVTVRHSSRDTHNSSSSPGLVTLLTITLSHSTLRTLSHLYRSLPLHNPRLHSLRAPRLKLRPPLKTLSALLNKTLRKRQLLR